MFYQNSLRRVGLVLSVLTLVGCAQNQTKTEDSVAIATPTNEVPVAPPSSAAEDARIAHAVQAAQAQVVVPNPSSVLFDKMSTTLDDKGREVIAQLAYRARSSKKLVVTGFCDRRQIGNPIDAAVARAISVRDELLAQGVVPTNVVVKFSTKIAKKHAAEIRFD